MKILSCHSCDVTTHGETFEEWMMNVMPHYMEAHADFLKDPTHTAEDKKRWMVENKVRFDAA